jgi:hypothetical protein
MIAEALARLDAYCRARDYQGWDLFDGLNSRLFRASPLYRCRSCRLAWIQLFKRSPVNLRALARVPVGTNPKGLALFASGLVALRRLDEARALLERLLAMASPGEKHTCWGYDFPWQARAFFVPTGKPNMVATTFAASALLDGHAVLGEPRWLEAARSGCSFMLDQLILHEDAETLCFGYIPGEDARVHNANLLGAALLGRVYALTGEHALLEKSRKAVAYTMRALDADGFWPYGERGHHRFIDNFHTGFNLVAMRQWMDATGDRSHEAAVVRAYRAYRDNFWLEDGRPKYFHDRLYPIDIHCSAQGIVTFLRLADYDTGSAESARRAASWAITHMQDEAGWFYYQQTRWYTNRIAYMRWAQAWMFYALATCVAAGVQGDAASVIDID